MPGKQRENGSLYCLQIPEYRALINDALVAQADQVRDIATQQGIPLVVKRTEDFLRAAAKEISDYTTTE